MPPPPIHPKQEEMLIPNEETVGTVDAPIVNDPLSKKFTWKIENFSRLTCKKLYSEVFTVGGYKWRVLIYPKGNGVDHLSMYLDVADSTTLSPGWSRYAQFKLAVVDQTNSKFTVQKDSKHQFDGRESDWGFTSFMPLSELSDPSKGYLLNDTCIVEADVVVAEPVEVALSAAPIEAAAAATATADAPIVNDSPSIRFTWKIKNFSRLTEKKLYSDVFSVGKYKWRVLIYPKGNGVDHLSMYLDVADSATLSSGWSRYAQFKLAVVDQTNSKFTLQKDSKHQFDGRESDWGFTSFMPLSELSDPSKGYLLNDTCIVEADVVVGPISLSVTPGDAVDALIVNDSPSIRFTWKIKNFSRLTEKKLYSDVFSVGEYKWRVLIYPKGNGVDHLSMYLDVADSATLSSGWSRYAQFKLAVVDQINSQLTMQKDSKHKFNGRESDWGFTSFMPLSELHDPFKGYLLNDTCIVEADVVVRKVVDVVT